MHANNKFKNSVFTMLFDDPDLLRELYCALEGVNLPQDTPVSINTLENVLFLDFNNDISFEIGGKLIVLVEHQSTVNPNMALRFLIYVCREMERLIEGKRLYSKKQLSIPWPEFFVLYNGPDPFPDEQILRLSDLFNNPKELGLPEKPHPLLELKARVININEGRNEEIVNRCKTLAGYSALMAKIRHFKKNGDNLEDAIKAAIKYCQKHDILKEFLKIHGSEVINMLLTLTSEDALAWAREEGVEEGLEMGIEKGHTEAAITIARNALSKGLPIETVHEITSLDIETVKKIANDK